MHSFERDHLLGVVVDDLVDEGGRRHVIVLKRVVDVGDNVEGVGEESQRIAKNRKESQRIAKNRKNTQQ